MRTRFVATSLLILPAFAPGVAAQTQSAAGTSVPPLTFTGTIRGVEVRKQPQAVAIEIAASAAYIPQALRLTGPDRLVFDFPGYELLGANRRMAVNAGPVEQVRLSQFSVHPPVTRVVIDCSGPLDFQVKTEGNKVVIEIATGAAMASGATEASAPSAPVSHVSPSSGTGSNPGAPSPAVPATPPSAAAPAPSGTTEKINKESAAPGPPALSTPIHSTASRVSAQTLQAKAKTLSLPELEALEDQAKTGDPEAETTLGLAYHDAVLLKRDDAESVRLLRKAAGRGFMAAEEALGLYAEKGIGSEKPEPAEAMEWFRKAERQGSLDAATNIALMYADGVGVTKDQAQALTWFRKAAEGGEGAAQYNLALIYARGEGVPQDYKESLHWLTLSAAQNVVPAILDLAGYELHPPDGSPADVQRAIGGYEKASELGSARAAAILGNIYATGVAGKPDYDQSAKWYRQAADQGQADGQYGLGIRYAFGQGVARDQQEARRLFTLAADQGLAPAQYNLATMCEQGNGAPADRSCALHYYQLAAEQGMAKAQYRLGRLIAGQQQNESDRVSAYKWLMLSEASVKESSAALHDLRKSMSEEEVAEGDREVDRWRKAHPTSRQ